MILHIETNLTSGIITEGKWVLSDTIKIANPETETSMQLDTLLVKMIESFCLATAPDEHEYLRNFKEALQKSISEA